MTSYLSLRSVERIWDVAPHSAFPDLLQWKGSLYCVLREGDAHESGGNGTLAILKREASGAWQLFDRLALEDRDLRDPKFSLSPDGSAYLLAGAGKRDKKGTYLSFDTVAMRYAAGKRQSWHMVGEPGFWLWRLTWHKLCGFGIAYFIDPTCRKKPWKAALWRTEDGLSFTTVCGLEAGDYPSEGSVVFLEDDTMLAVLRRGKGSEANAWLGKSKPPYHAWKWSSIGQHLGAPALYVDKQNCLWVSGRIFDGQGNEKTCIGRLENEQLHVDLLLPSDGDSSYPSLFVEEENRWLLAYYSSHEEGRASIYLATIDVV